jgi:hypothetical protein
MCEEGRVGRKEGPTNDLSCESRELFWWLGEGMFEDEQTGRSETWE